MNSVFFTLCKEPIYCQNLYGILNYSRYALSSCLLLCNFLLMQWLSCPYCLTLFIVIFLKLLIPEKNSLDKVIAVVHYESILRMTDIYSLKAIQSS